MGLSKTDMTIDMTVHVHVNAQSCLLSSMYTIHKVEVAQ